MPYQTVLIGQALLLFCCLSSVGCNYRQPPYPAIWEIETVAPGQAQAAFLAADGSIAVRYHIERKLQPGHSGYHWLIIEPEAAALVLRPKTKFTHPEHTLYHRSFAQIRSEASDPKFDQPVNARMVPPILDPGLPDDQLPASIARPVQPLVMVAVPDAYSASPGLSLRKPEVPDIETREIDLWPTMERYQTEQGAAHERRYRTVTEPINVAGDILTWPCRAAFELYLDWVWAKSRL